MGLFRGTIVEQFVNHGALARRARAYIGKMPAAISGQHGHNATFAVAKKLVHDFGMTKDEAWPLLRIQWPLQTALD
jgi:hypothetical protein